MSGAADSVKLTPTGSGEFSASGLSPTQYSLTARAPGAVALTRFVTLKPGETSDLGTIRMEKAIAIRVSSRVAPKPPFTQPETVRQTLLGGDPFKADPRGYTPEFSFRQVNGEIRFGLYSLPLRIADLGPGKLEDFLEADTAAARYIEAGTGQRSLNDIM